MASIKQTHKDNKINADIAYILKDTKTGKYINIDRTSGGYPYKTSFHNAKLWYDKTEAKEYYNICSDEEWTIHKVTVEDTPCVF